MHHWYTPPTLLEDCSQNSKELPTTPLAARSRRILIIGLTAFLCNSSVQMDMSVQTSGAGSEAIPRDQVFGMLSNRRRRWVLYVLSQQDGDTVDFGTVVDAVSAWEYDVDPAELSWKQRKRIYTALRQSHLPKLDETGIINYDRDRGTVELTDHAQEVQLYLEYVPKNDIPWSYCYLGFSCLGLGLGLLSWGSVGPFAGLSGLMLVWVLVGLFAVTAVVHTHHSRRNRLGTTAPPADFPHIGEP